MEDPDDILVRQVALGDADAYRRLVERHLARIVAFASRWLGDPTAAEDVAQEVFLRLWTHAATWRSGEARVSTWLHKIALNLCRDRRARRSETSADAVPEPIDATPSPLDRMQQATMATYVNSALASLPETQRSAITLCHYQGLRNTEAARIMELSVEAVESLLARGRRTLRARLAAIAPEFLDGSPAESKRMA